MNIETVSIIQDENFLHIVIIYYLSKFVYTQPKLFEMIFCSLIAKIL
jgi:hypothetical protein